MLNAFPSHCRLESSRLRATSDKPSKMWQSTKCLVENQIVETLDAIKAGTRLNELAVKRNDYMQRSILLLRN